MTLEMPSDPFGTPSGFFTSLDPPQEMSTLDDPYPLSSSSPNFDFIMDFEADLDSSFEALGDEVVEDARENVPPPVVEVKPSTPPAGPVSTRAPSMPTILEEDEQEEEDGDVTITPSEAQRALLPPDRFARPPSASWFAGAADTSLDARSDSLDTPRPRGRFRFCFISSVVISVTDFRNCGYSPAAQASTFSVPAPDAFDASFSIETGLDASQVSQDSFGQFDFSAFMANESTVSDFDASFDVDIPAWNEAVFGESLSQEPTPSSSSSWEVTSEEGPSMVTGMGTGIVDVQLQFPSVKVDEIGDRTSMPTEDEFLRVVIEAAQSTPRTVSLISYFIHMSVRALIHFIRVNSVPWFA